MGFNSRNKFSPTVRVIILFGIISLLGDVIYEGARSVNSQYFNLLGISATKVGLVFGLGEFLGYFLRLFTGVLSDKTGKYWSFMFVGYGLLVVVPIMGLTMNWNILVILILMERIGKSLRNPAKDTILSSVADNQVGIGFAFGLQEALDQIGAFTGPLIFSAVFLISGQTGVTQYQTGYQLLFGFVILLMLFLYYSWRKVKTGNLISIVKQTEYRSEHLRSIFWMYTAFTFFCTLGLVNFSTIGYHLKADGLLSDGNITLLYSGAMIMDAITALVVGKVYDNRKAKTGTTTGGLLVLTMIPIITVSLPFLTLGHSVPLIITGMLIFGIIMGTHETIMRSAIADITPFYKRGTSYGVFNAAYGLALFGGAALMGLLYDQRLIGLIMLFSTLMEIIAVVLFVKMEQMIKKAKS